MIPAYKEYSETTVWDATSGLEPAALEAKCRELLADESVTYAEARTNMICFMLDNAQIADEPHDVFPDKLRHENIGIDLRWEKRAQIAANEMKAVMDKADIHMKEYAYIADTDFGHIAPDWTFVMENGIFGTIAILEDLLAQADTDEKRTFFTCSLKCWQAIQRFALRLADKKEREGNTFAVDNLRGLASHKPATLAEAMQLTFLVYMAQTYVESTTIRGLGRLDSLYYPFYCADVAAGRLTEAEARLLLRHFLGRMPAMKVTANLPVGLCGMDADGNDATNDMTRMMLEEYDALDIYDPKFHIYYHDGIAPDVLERVFDMIRRGRNSFVFNNSPVVIRGLMNIGIAPEDARNFIILGCYEPGAMGTEVPSTCGGHVSMPKAIDYTIDKDYPDFDAFYAALKENVRMLFLECMDTIKAFEAYYDRICPAPILSATYASCREKGVDIFSGGAKYNNTSVVASSTASLVDMVLAVKKAIYDEKRATMDELRAALAANWEGYEELRYFCAEQCPKYGNGNPEADAIAADISSFIADIINGYPNGRGGVFRCGMFSVDYRYYYGSGLGATPDGRFAGEPLSKNFCACIGKDLNGVTALVNSVAKLDYSKIPDGSVLDLVLHPSAVSGEDGMTALKSLLKTYFFAGGQAIQFNVMNADTLRKAQADPQRYRNLQVRLCGWNVYFVNLPKADQDEFINQAERA